MLGRNPLFVAQQHGHRILTMLTTYAAWTEGSLEADIAAIRQAMNMSAYAARSVSARNSELGNRAANSSVRPRRRHTRKTLQETAIERPTSPKNLAIDLPMATRQTAGIPSNYKHLDWRSGRDSNPQKPSQNQQPVVVETNLIPIDSPESPWLAPKLAPEPSGSS
jgi:hypothetical protein